MMFFTGSENNKLAADVMGDSRNQPVILMHGGGQTRHAWRDAAKVLADEGFFVISVDMRGHGNSDWVSSGNYSIVESAADINTIVERLSRPPMLVGASYGGLTSLYLAGKYPDKIKAVVLVDVVAKINPEGVKPIRQFMNSNREGFSSLREAADSIAEYLPHRKKPTNLDGLKKNLRLRENGRYYWHWDPAFMASTETQKIYDELEWMSAGINMPALLVHGGLSDVVNDEGIRHLRELISHVEYIKVENAGHMVAGDKNNEFQNAVIDFLQRVKV